MSIFTSKKKEIKALQAPNGFISIFHMKFNFNSQFTRCILGKISEVVNSSWYRSSIDPSEDMSTDEIRDFSNLKSSLEFLKTNIETITNLVVDGSAFRLTVQCSKQGDYEIEINMEVDKFSNFYNDLINHVELEIVTMD